MILLDKAVRLNALGIELFKGGDIYYFEGPYLSHFVDERGMDYMMSWVDLDGAVNRWLLFSIEPEFLNRYFSQKSSLRETIEASITGSIYIVDLDSQGTYQNIWILRTEDLPPEYRPKENSFFDPVHSEKYSFELAKLNKMRLTADRESMVRKISDKLFNNDRLFTNSIYSVNLRCFTDPSKIDEIAIGQTLTVPLMIHYHHKSDLRIKNLLSATSLRIYERNDFDKYLSTVYQVIVNETLPKRYNTQAVLKEIFQCTAAIVRERPEVYGRFYNGWLSTVKMEYTSVADVGNALKGCRQLSLLGIDKSVKKK